MSYRVMYEEDVIREDFPKLDELNRQRVIKEVREKLSVAPDQLGRPLRRALKGYRRLRVGDYRVIYRVEPEEALLFVVMVIHRRTEYRGVKERISRHQKHGSASPG